VHFNFGFFELHHLAAFMAAQSARRPVVISLHRTQPIRFDDEKVSLQTIAPALASVARIIVHQRANAAYLEEIGITDNVEVIPLGAPNPPSVEPQTAKDALRLTEGPLLGSFGFLLPHKGTLELLQATRILRSSHPDLRVLCLCARHPDSTSAAYESICREFVRKYGLDDIVMLVTDFLEDELARNFLRACDVIALPYLQTEESSSATLRFVLPAERPIVASDLAIFDDAREALSLVRPGDVDHLVNRLDELFRSEEKRAHLAALTAQAARSFNWDGVADRHAAVYAEVTRGWQRP
jgi:glycosyltransferase involved in cell wall biosynthesis